jgi:hypothetical protein
MREGLLLTGVGLIGVGVLPTPDDVTIISPLIQILAGSVFVVCGLVMDEKKD